MTALKEIPVLDLSMNLPGPYMTWLLTGMGAEVVKVEPSQHGDLARSFSDPKQQLYFPLFNLVNRGKKSLTLDLNFFRSPINRAIFH